MLYEQSRWVYRPVKKQSWQFVLNLLVLAVASHSIAGGVLLLFFPLWTLKLVGWNFAGQVFWPSQAGLFLVLLGGVYASAIRLRVLVWFLIVSKACAIVFLLLSFVFLDAPRVVIAMAIVDGLMGLSVALMYWKEMRVGDPA